ncbi:MAG: 30S ribosomal protein S18 [Candidatus Moeniiplasma glomeromycotorum]|nr:30S ribosomal protein S18 [Candidatus Moeniiplasma glomeromycotorum]MCE8162532.1 30S ribosomal protein S18 [Candidatus Moeniiplasma glomeromycotorum]MCE8166542.1 30S ribosomal protein S18 [Candidatus Moeniiplasma glomeromycotorum]MCE8166987.1 30S ribosomal protein S18 [Candidatus Moeniiplasma glomeromycotorum]
MKKPYYAKKRKKTLHQKKGGLGIGIFDYKDPQLLSKFIGFQGEIKNRVANGSTAKEQRRLSKAIKRARQMGILPYQIVEQKVFLKKPETPKTEASETPLSPEKEESNESHDENKI